jgi:Holliday junction resolvase
MSTASKGRAFEHEIRELLRGAGFSVIRGAGSKGELLEEKVDLVATRMTRENEYRVWITLLGLQCKVRRKRLAGA